MGLVGFIAGCGGGAVAPVHSIGGPETSARAVPETLVRAVPEMSARAAEYLVGKGDTVYSIAWRHGVDYRELARFNSIRGPFIIHPGQRLLIPGPGDVVPPAPAPSAAAIERAGAADLSTRGTGVQAAPLVKPLPQSASLPPVKTPSASTAAAKQQRKALPAASASRTVPKPASAPSAVPPVATRTVAGLSWARPTTGKAVGGFGRSGNKGLDIAGDFEQPIRAASRGRVVYAGGGLVGYGKLVIVKHNSRLLSAYAHNERLHVKEGDDVNSGQHIADMGRSAKGRTMLHFEIRRDGKPVDPLRYLP